MLYLNFIETLEKHGTCLQCNRRFGKNPFAKVEVELGKLKRICSCGWSMKMEEKMKGQTL